MERWLTQRMSARARRDAGRAATASARTSSSRSRGGSSATRSRRRRASTATTDPWLPERAVWPLLEVVDECLDEPWLARARARTSASRRRGAARAAVRDASATSPTLFDRYALHRPEMLRAGPGATTPTPTAPRCPRRRVAGRAVAAAATRGSPCPARPSGSSRRCARLEADPALVDLPPRLSLFGLTRLPAGHLRRAARARRAHRDVHLFVAAPVAGAVGRVAERAGARAGRPARATTRPRSLPRNRLLASWGQDARELQLVLGARRARRPPPPGRRTRADTLLAPHPGRRARPPPPGAPLPGDDDERPLLDPTTASIQVHACHGRARQVEVVRDAILHLLEDDDTLEPRDVIVMCPDIETFAPLIQATFGAGEVAGDDDELDALPRDVAPPDLRVRLADRSLRQTNPVLGVVAPAASSWPTSA